MSTSKHIDKICIAAVCLTLVITILFMFGEKLGIIVVHREEDENINGMFTANDLDADWDTADACNIVLNGDSARISGNGAYFANDTLYIACAGKYVISGTLEGSIQVDADGDDKIWLLFDGVDIISETGPPLYIEQAEKVFLTLQENSQNTLACENRDAEAEADGCIFSRDDLTVNGKGNLTVTSTDLHGIVCNDSLVFTGGNVIVSAKADGIHARDAIRICNTAITVSAGDDGLHAGNDDETALFYLKSGNINITECYEGIEANDITIAGGTVYILPSDDGINASGSGKTSQITVSGGNITVINKNGRDADGFDSNGSINITGGNVFISVTGTGTNNAIDYGSENGGKCTVSGGTLIACGSSQMTEYPGSDSAQGFITETVSGSENETISVLGVDGKEIISKEIPCSFTSVIISSPDIAVGDTVTLKVGDTETEIVVDNTGTGGTGGFGNKGGFNPGDRNGQGNPSGRDGQNPFDNKEGNTPPELPNGSVEGGTFPQRPNEDKDPQQKPDGNLPGSDMPEGQNDTHSEMSDPDNHEDRQMPDEMQSLGENEQGENGNSTFESPENDNKKQNSEFFGDNRAQKSQDRMRDNKADNNNDNKELSNKKSVMSMSTRIIIGVSVIVLIGGLLIAVKKKY